MEAIFVSAILPILLILAGAFSFFCSFMNYPFFMNHRKAVTMRRILGDTLTRVFYMILGIALVVAGIVFFAVGLPQQPA